MVSVAVGYAHDTGAIQHARVVLGGVAPIPWRSPQAEAILTDSLPRQSWRHGLLKPLWLWRSHCVIVPSSSILLAPHRPGVMAVATIP